MHQFQYITLFFCYMYIESQNNLLNFLSKIIVQIKSYSFKSVKCTENPKLLTIQEISSKKRAAGNPRKKINPSISTESAGNSLRNAFPLPTPSTVP